MAKTRAELIADRVADVPRLGRPDLLRLRATAANMGTDAAALVSAIDARLEDLDLAAGIRVHEEEFARTMMRIVDSTDGDWIPAADVFRRAKAEAADNAYVAYIATNSGRQKGLTSTLDRVRTSEFPHIERRKEGTETWDRVYFRRTD
jgi:hypothetical protein